MDWAILISIWVVLIVLVAGGVFVLRVLASSPERPVIASRFPAAKDSPERVLAERYARGEIDTDEFLERGEILSGLRRNVTSSDQG